MNGNRLGYTTCCRLWHLTTGGLVEVGVGDKVNQKIKEKKAVSLKYILMLYI